MAKIVVAHQNINIKGGGEAVCMTVLEALQNEHDVTLLTSTKLADLGSLNRYFGTDVSDIKVEYIEIAGIELSSMAKLINMVGVGKFDYFTSILNQGLFHRYCRKSLPECDLFISTWDEISVDFPSIQYIHFPNRYDSLMETDDLDIVNPLKLLIRSYKAAVRRLANFDPDSYNSDIVLANSRRTALKYEEYYGELPYVLNPPIDTDGLSSHPSWKERENGFIFLSRIHPVKNIHWLIEILDKVHNQQQDFHFHIIGPKDANHVGYFNEIKRLANDRDYVELDGPMYGDELKAMLKTHKFGINGAVTEQFGMAIAEMVAAGMIPFVPNNGGQREIVGNNPAVMFDSTSEATDKITALFSSPELQKDVRESFPDIEERYGKKAFQEEVRSIVRSLSN